MKKLIGKGSFTKAYLLPSGEVELYSVDPVKECAALWGFGDSYLWPKIERVDILDDLNSTQVYRMPFYKTQRALKNFLEPRQYALYRTLRALPGVYCLNPHLRAFELHKVFDTIPDEFADEREALKEAVDSLCNYGTDICFEISPRNVAAVEGKLILLDVFFFQATLKKFSSR